MQEHVWKVGDRVVHRRSLAHGTLLNFLPTGASWRVTLDNSHIVRWYIENLLPEPPLESLARTLKEDRT
jgi:hypothetical protein